MQNKLKVSRRKDVIKSRNQWNWKQNNKENEKQKSGSLKRVKKIDKSLARLTKQKKPQKHKLPISWIKTKHIIMDPKDVKRILRDYYEHHPHKFDNLDEMDELLKKYKLSQTHLIWNHLNSPANIQEIEFVV